MLLISMEAHKRHIQKSLTMDGSFLALQRSDLCQQRRKKYIFAIKESKINHLLNLIGNI